MGFRLLWLGARTRRLPELMIGGAFVWAGGVPGVLLALADDGSGHGPNAHGGMLAAVSLSPARRYGASSRGRWRGPSST